MTYVGTYSSNGGTEGGDKHAITPERVEKFDDDTFKLTLSSGKSYLLTNNTKVFLYTAAGLGGSASSNRDATKAVTASELAEIKSSSDFEVYATGVTLSGSTNASTLEAVAFYCVPAADGSKNYFETSAGTKYPALISSITQSVVSGSDSKYDFEISAWINGEKQSLKTEQKTNTQFNSDILKENSKGKKFSSADDAKNKLAWITLNGSNVVTEIVPVVESNEFAGNDNTAKNGGVVWTATRAIIVSKNSQGLTYIPYGGTGANASNNGWVLDSTGKQISIISSNDKVALSDFAAYAKDAAFYTLNVRPNYANITASVKKGPDGDYTVSSATAADILVSSISGSSADVYYTADLFFNDDGDILAVYVYDKDLANSSNYVSPEDTSTVVGNSTGTGTIGNPITFTVTNPDEDSFIQSIFDDRNEKGTVYTSNVNFAQIAQLGNARVSTVNSGNGLSDGNAVEYYIAVDANNNKTYYVITYTNSTAAKVTSAKEAVAEATLAATAATTARDNATTTATAKATEYTEANQAVLDSDYAISTAGKALADAQTQYGEDSQQAKAMQKVYDDAVAAKKELEAKADEAAMAKNAAEYEQSLANLKLAEANVKVALAQADEAEAKGDKTTAAAYRSNAAEAYKTLATQATTLANIAAGKGANGTENHPLAVNASYEQQFKAFATQMTNAAEALEKK
jgi:hypothetical protein